VSGQLEEGAPEVRPREEALPRSRYPRLNSYRKFFLKAPVSQAVGLERALSNQRRPAKEQLTMRCIRGVYENKLDGDNSLHSVSRRAIVIKYQL
jgi:hypothetical protein